MLTTSFFVIASCVFSIVFSTTYKQGVTGEFQAAKTALQAAKASWLSAGITDYVYNWQAGCYCEQCYVQKKYIVIEDGTPTYVEFDAAALAANPSLSCAPMDHIKTPLSKTFHDITYYYDVAIAYAQRGLDADCTNPYNDMVCGGSLSFTYDPTYFYPTAIALNKGDMVADAGQSWAFSCLAPLSDTSACAGFTLPSEGDACGESGIDCAATKGACAICSDGSGKSFGCCGRCTLVENSNGELFCSSCIPQELVCPAAPPSTCTCTAEYDPYCCEGTTYSNGCVAHCDGFAVDDCAAGACAAKCGGFAGFTCANGMECVDDPNDGCDPKNGGADCMGICVATTTTTTTTTTKAVIAGDCLRVTGSKVAAINGIYGERGSSDGVASYRNKKAKRYRGRKVRMKLYRLGTYSWMFGTEKGSKERITECGPVKGTDAFMECDNKWNEDPDLQISYASCTAKAFEVETAESANAKTTAISLLVIGAVLIVIAVAFGVFMWRRVKNKQQMQKELVLEEEEVEAEEDELEVVMETTA